MKRVGFRAIVLFLAFVLAACAEPRTDSHSLAATDSTVTAVNAREFVIAEYDSSDEKLEKELYGKFFQDRAVFYVIDNPNKTLHDCPVTQMTVSYLDQQLAQMKYTLEGNPTNALIRTHKNQSWRIMGCDSINRGILRKESPVVKTPGGYVINSRLQNYLIRWKLDDKEMMLRVHNGKSEYIERTIDYASTFKSIEAHSGG